MFDLIILKKLMIVIRDVFLKVIMNWLMVGGSVLWKVCGSMI